MLFPTQGGRQGQAQEGGNQGGHTLGFPYRGGEHWEGKVEESVCDPQKVEKGDTGDEGVEGQDKF